MHTEFVNALFAWVAANPGWMSAFIFLSATAESLTVVGVIIPGALIMFSLGALIGLGHIDFWTAYGWSTCGAIIGDAISFWIGRIFHQGVRRCWPFRQHPELIARSEEFFRRHGGKSVLFGRFFGPVRGTIPTVAGMMDMRWQDFMVANVISGILWAPVYLLPGMAFGASLDIAARVAGRLALLIVIVVATLWTTAWLVRYVGQLAQTHAFEWLRRFTDWSKGRRWIGPIAASLLDPRENELRGLAALAVLLLGGTGLVSLSLSTAGHSLPSGLDQSFYHFFQELRTPWVDAVMVFIAELGDYQVMLPVSIAVLGWLMGRGYREAAGHWLAALGFGMVTNLMFQGFLPRAGLDEGGVRTMVGHSFPSSHATFSTLVFGFLAVLLAREMTPSRHWVVYLGAAFLVVPIAFARLYLGIHWLTDTLAGLCLGVIWVTVLGIAYHQHPKPSVPWRRLLVWSIVALLGADTLHISLHYRRDLQRYEPRSVETILTSAEWHTQGWQKLPLYRLDFQGRRRQPLTLQWAGTREQIQQHLEKAGWRPAPGLTVKNLLLWLSPQTELRELPVLPQLHNGREDELRMVCYDSDPDNRWVLRFWDVGVRLEEEELPIWVGSINRQQRESRWQLLTLALDQPEVGVPERVLAPAWQGLHVVQRMYPLPRSETTPQVVTLIKDGIP